MNNRNQQAMRQTAVVLAALTYAFAVVYGDVMFLSVVSSAFPRGTILEALAYAGAIVTAVSALVLPIALHWWFAPGLQFVAGVMFWFVDIAALVLNSVLAYAIALNTVDGTLHVWQMLAPATPMLAVLGWGILFLLDPSHRLRHAVAELEADQVDIFAQRLREHARSQQTDAALAEGAARSAAAYAHILTQGPAVQGHKPAAMPPARLNAELQQADPAIVPAAARKNGAAKNS